MRTALRLGIALAIIVPLLLWLGGGWLTTFAIALLGFGTGRAVEHMAFGPPHGGGDGRLNVWIAAAFALLGLVLLAGVQLVEYRLQQQRDDAIQQRSQAQEVLQQTLRAEQDAAQEKIWRVEVLADGSLTSDGQPASLETLSPPSGAQRAEVVAGSDAAYDRVIAVMDKIRAAGIDTIVMATR